MRMCITLMAVLSLSPATGAGEDNVSVTTRLSQDGVHAGSNFRAALVVTVRKGWHINSASPSDENLIPTSASFSPPAGTEVGEVQYPRGVSRTFAFSESPLDVYEGTVVILVKITASKELKPGTYDLPVEISYQACTNDVCFAPATATVVIPVHVLSPDVAPVPLETGLFGPGAEK